ncbi:unnamed protein product [Effrenium voratum]|nr:unnamed protein product [Effrenium voratum]
MVAPGKLLRLRDYFPLEMADNALQILENLPEEAWQQSLQQGDSQPQLLARPSESADVMDIPELAPLRSVFWRMLPSLRGRPTLPIFSCGRYGASDFIGRHDDQALVPFFGDGVVYSRTVAAIWYLTKDWSEAEGGSLVDLEADEEKLVPIYNSLVVFEVPHWHAVSAVTAQRYRYSIFGWWHQKDEPSAASSSRKPTKAKKVVRAKKRTLASGASDLTQRKTQKSGKADSALMMDAAYSTQSTGHRGSATDAPGEPAECFEDRSLPSKGETKSASQAEVQDSEACLRRRVQRAARPKLPGDEELWRHVWRCVEGEAPNSAHEPKPREPCYALVVYRRLTGKQPPGRATFGHYDVLGLARSASAAQIHAAYRRRALATHPDKGGNVEEFRRVVAAFEELADARRRAAYDRALRMFGRSDGTGQSFEATAATSRAPGGARALQLQLLASAAMERRLRELPLAQLQALDELLRARPLKRFMPSAVELGPNVAQLRGGYRVSLAWHGLQLSSNLTPCLAQAIDWQIALQQLRARAERRLADENAGLERSPLLWEELLDIAEQEPSLELSFAAVWSRKSKPSTSPVVQDLTLALDFWRRFQALPGASSDAALRRLKQQAAAEAKRSRAQRKGAQKRLAGGLRQELRRRRRNAKEAHSGGPAQQQVAHCETRLVLWRRIRGKTPESQVYWA